MRLDRGIHWVSRLLPALLLLPLLSGCGQLDQSQLSTQVQSLMSLAQEGIVLAQGVVDGNAHAPFVQVHADEMASAASDVADSFSGQQIPSQLTSDVGRTKQLADRLSKEMEQLSQSPDDRQKAQAITQALEADVQQIKTLPGANQ